MQPTVAPGLRSEETFTITEAMTTAHTGTAVFSTPVLNLSAPAPMAVFHPPVVVLLSELTPTAVLFWPVVRLKRALFPSAVLPPG